MAKIANLLIILSVTNNQIFSPGKLHKLSFGTTWYIYSKFLSGSSAVNMTCRHVIGDITSSLIGLAQVECCRHSTNLSSFER